MKKEVNGSVPSLKERERMEKEQEGRLRSLYVAPLTTRTVVETEGNFCGSVIDETDPDTQTGMKTTRHGFASEQKPDGSMPDWELDLSTEEWDK